MRSRHQRLLATTFSLALGLLTGQASAQRIVLVRPSSSDPALLSAFAHLQGELKVHAFEVVLIDTTDETSPNDLERAAAREGAVAAISLLRSHDAASADIWVSDRATGKISRRSITTPQRPEGPNLLAVRAVDLLRASLRELEPDATLPPDIVGAAPERAPERVRDWARTDASHRSLSLTGGALVQAPVTGFGPAVGPLLAVGYAPTAAFGLRLELQGPLWGSRYVTDNASATLLQQQLLAEARLRLWHLGDFSCSASAGAGASHLTARGEATTPYAPAEASSWTALAGLGLGAEWRLARVATLSLRGRSFVLVPKPVVQVGADRVSYGRPLLQLAGGLDVAF